MSSAQYSDETAKRVLAAIDQDETIAFLRDLVRFPSVNPPGDVRDASPFARRSWKRRALIAGQLAIDEIMPNRSRKYGPEGGPTLCFNAHLDVVPTGELEAWSHGPFDAGIWLTGGFTAAVQATTRPVSRRR